MRFEAVEKVPMEDSQRVLAVLEEHLRKRLPGEVERTGSRIVLSGLGPSSRTINPRDTTVIEVTPESGATRVDIAVNFQASSLLTPVGQEEIVRSKLNRVFGAARRQIEEESQQGIPVYRESGSTAATSTDSSISSLISSSAEVKLRRLPEPGFADPQPKQASRVNHEAYVPPAGAQTSGASSGTAAERGDLFAQPSGRTPGSWMPWVAVAAALLVSTPLGLHYWKSAQPAPLVIDLTKQVAQPAPAERPITASGPEGALRQWELAMRGSDAAAQAAYYAIPVEQYMYRHNVNRADLERMKQAEIQKRQTGWTIALENMDVKREGDLATVTMVKHITEPRAGGGVRERLVRSEMKLRNSLGIWWIVSERDLWAPRRPAVSEDGTDGEGAAADQATPAAAGAGAAATSSSASTD